MRRLMILGLGLTLMGCSSGSDSNSGPAGADSGADGRTDVTSGNNDSGNDATTSNEGGDANDSGNDATTSDDGGDAANDSGSGDTGSADADAGPELDASCPASWLLPPSFDPQLDVPEGGVVLLHAEGVGTQIYACIAGDAGGTWVLQGPNANLNDCHGDVIGHHFASDGGSAYPEWQTTDGTYVIGHKMVGITPDGGSGSVPWLLLQAVDAGGAGPLSQTTYIQRLDTDGGLATGACDAGDTVQIPYTADYFFYKP
jgi:hypothetical protein